MSTGHEMPEGREVSEGHGMPLSAAQSGIWFAHHLRPGNLAYNTGEYLDIPGPVDAELFERALRRVVDEAESLRVRFTVGGDGPRQTVAASPDWSMHRVDLTSAPDPRRAAEEWMRADLSTPVDLTRGPLFCQALIRIAPDHFLWYQRVHHVLVDGFSMSLVARRVARTYTRLAAGAGGTGAGSAGTGSTGTGSAGAAFGPLSLLLARDAEYRASEQRALDREFWVARMAGRPAPVRLAGRSAPASDRFLRRTSSLSASTVAALRQVAQQAGTSWPTALIAAVAAYLHRIGGERDVVLSMPVTARTDSSGRAVPGMVANVVPLRLRVRPQQGLSALVRQAAEEIGALRAHQRYRGEDLRRDLRGEPGGKPGGEPGQDRSDQVLFGPVVNIMAFYYHLDFAGVRATAHNLSNGPVEDLSFSVYDRSDGTAPRVDLDANPLLYSDAGLTAHQQRFLGFLDTLLAAGPDRPIGAADVLTPAERRLTLVTRNRTAHPLPDTTLPRAFADRAARTPDAPAVVLDGATLSCAELNARANRLAHRLIARGVRAETTVAVLMERSADVVVSVLAISKAGGCYVPLDTRSPVARLRLVMAGTRARLLLTHRATQDHELSHGTPGIVVDADPGLAGEPDVDPVVPLRPDHLACVLYTSGSTGTPKGVALSHRNVLSMTSQRCWQGGSGTHRPHDPHGSPGPRVLAHSPHAFDASTYEWWVPLLNGGQVIMAPPGELDLATRHRLVVDHRVSALWLTAGLFRVFAEESPGSLAQVDQVWTGGDIVPADAVRRVHTHCPDTVVVAGYGPTESATFTTRTVLGPGRAVPEVVPIGRPMDNRRVYVLDRALSPVPPGVAGVLYIAGPGVARGYLGDPRLTADQFVPCPFGGPGERMYRTDDVVRWNPDGELEFLGRADDQVKLHGFRIEPGEIEAVLARHPGVAQATVAVHPGAPDTSNASNVPGTSGASGTSNASGDRRLTGYVVPAGGQALDMASLRAHAVAALPDYMVPSAIVVLDAFPLTPNGKIDRAALPLPDLAPPPSAAGTGTPVEEAVCALFAEVLGRSAAGVHEDFFALGGTSLLATRLVNRVRVRFGRELTLGALFQSPTPARLAAALDRAPDTAVVPGPARRNTPAAPAAPATAPTVSTGSAS